MTEQFDKKPFLRATRTAMYFAAGFSLIINLLMLTVPLYMLQLFDRVLSSQSTETLLYLTLIAVIALCVMTALDVVRQRLLVSVGEWIGQSQGLSSLWRSVDNQLRQGNYAMQSLSDVQTLKQFFSGSAIVAFFDAPWVIIYIGVIYLLSLQLGVMATIGAIFLFLLAWFNEWVLRQDHQEAQALSAQNHGFIQSVLSQTDLIKSMGMNPAFVGRWQAMNGEAMSVQRRLIHRSNQIISIAKLIRLILQIAILGMGAYLVIDGSLSAGGMIAASILLGRGLAPIEQGMTAWKSFLEALSAYRRLSRYLSMPVPPEVRLSAEMQGALQLNDVSYTVDGRAQPILQNIKFVMPAAQSLAIIGPVASGKSTLARLMVGLIKSTYGTVRLDGLDVYQLSASDRSVGIGYLPQGTAFITGTVQDNITRLQPIDDDAFTKACEITHTAQLIKQLPNGPQTCMDGYNLSAGQRQRIALARAFYGYPRFIVLDEPETNLDQDGLVALIETLKRAQAQQISLVVITQNPQVARIMSRALVLRQGRVQELGDANAIVDKWLGGA